MKSVTVTALALVLALCGAACVCAHVHTDAKEHKQHTHDSVATEAVHHALHLDDADTDGADVPGTGVFGLPHGDDDGGDDDSDDIEVAPLTEEEQKVYAAKLESYLSEKCATATAEVRAAFGVCDDTHCQQPPQYAEWPRASCLLHEQNVTLAEVTHELKTVLQLYGVDTLQALDQIEAEEEADLAAEEAAFYAEEGHEVLEPPAHTEAGVAGGADAAATTGAAAPATA